MTEINNKLISMLKPEIEIKNTDLLLGAKKRLKLKNTNISFYITGSSERYNNILLDKNEMDSTYLFYEVASQNVSILLRMTDLKDFFNNHPNYKYKMKGKDIKKECYRINYSNFINEYKAPYYLLNEQYSRDVSINHFGPNNLLDEIKVNYSNLESSNKHELLIDESKPLLVSLDNDLFTIYNNLNKMNLKDSPDYGKLGMKIVNDYFQMKKNFELYNVTHSPLFQEMDIDFVAKNKKTLRSSFIKTKINPNNNSCIELGYQYTDGQPMSASYTKTDYLYYYEAKEAKLYIFDFKKLMNYLINNNSTRIEVRDNRAYNSYSIKTQDAIDKNEQTGLLKVVPVIITQLPF